MKGFFHPDGSFLLIQDNGRMVVSTVTPPEIGEAPVYELVHEVNGVRRLRLVQAMRVHGLDPVGHRLVHLVDRLALLAATVKLFAQALRQLSKHEIRKALLHESGEEIVIIHSVSAAVIVSSFDRGGQS